MKHETINEKWKAFAKAIGLEGAHPIQLQEMKRAFFGGWHDCQCTLGALSDALPEEEACERLSKYRDECRGFKDAVLSGDA